MSGHYLSRLLVPRSIALVGATEDPARVGGRILDNLLAGGWAGTLYAVHPRHAEVRGVRCWPDVASLPAVPDVAILTTPADTIAGLVEECGRAGIKGVVVVSGGFSESGEEGRARQLAVAEAARRHGVRVLGPNSLGFMRPSAKLNATFARGAALEGSLALVSQSGAVCTALLDWATPTGVGFSSVISLGGCLDLDFGEVIDYLAADERTQHILLYIEGVRDGRRLVSSLRAAARIKPVIVMKVGRNAAGTRAAVSHTGAIVGRDEVFDAVVRRTGVVRVKTVNQLVAAAAALAGRVRPAGDRLAIVTNGGGGGVMAADRAAELELPLAQLAPATLDKLQAALPPHWSRGNPVDLLGDAGPERYRAAITACLEDPGVDGVVAILAPQALTEADAVAEAIVETVGRSSKPVLACFMGEASVRAARDRIRRAKVPVLRWPETAVEGFAYLSQFYRNQRVLLEAPPPHAAHEPPDVDRAQELVRNALDEGRDFLLPTESKELLEAFRIPIVRSHDAADVDEAVELAERVGYPVVMKIKSPDVTHKSDVDGVRLLLASAEAVRAAWDEIMIAVRARRPGARILGMSIERMITASHGRELMVGIGRDEVFGPVVTFGAGGISADVLHDRVVALPPLNHILVEDLVRGTRVARMLGEFRHLPAVHRAALEELLLRVSEIACELPEVHELDVNPVVADEYGVLALDARVVLRRPGAGLKRYGHLAIPPYPVGLDTLVRLRDAGTVVLRPIRPEDAEMEMAFVEALSPQSRRMRFQSALRTLTPSMLARFTQIDYDHEMALVAIEGEGAAERMVGVVRYIEMPDARSCEYAIVVADDYQGRGLGRRMMERIIALARERGLEEMVGFVLAANDGMLDMCHRLGFVDRVDEEDPHSRRVVLDLTRAAA